MTFQKRLQRALRDGNLTVADLARLFGRSHATVRSWIRDGYEPRGGAADRVHLGDRLNDLELKIKRQAVPPGLDRESRRQFLSSW